MAPDFESDLFRKIAEQMRLKLPHGFPDREAIFDDAWVKWLRNFEGVWLFALVRQAATGPNETLPKRGLEVVKARIEEYARILAPEMKGTGRETSAEAIVASSVQNLNQRIEGDYHRRLLTRVICDRWRKLRRFKGLDEEWDLKRLLHGLRTQRKDAQDDWGERARRWKSRELLMAWRPKMAEHPARLAIYGLFWYTGRLPQDVVDEWGGLRVAEVLQALAFRIAQDKQWASFALPVIKDLKAACARPEAAQRLCEFWNPEKILTGWLARPSQGGSAAATRLLHDKLGFPKWRIVTEFGPLRMGEVSARFVKLFKPSTADGEVLKELAKVEARPNDIFATYFKSSRIVSDWRQKVDGEVSQAAWLQARSALRALFLAPVQPWELLAFLACHCLSESAAELAQQFGPRPLLELERKVALRFASIYNKEDTVALTLFETHNLKLRPVAGQPLAEFGGGSLAGDLSRWAAAVRRAVEPQFIKGRSAPVFAYRHGLWEPSGGGPSDWRRAL